MKSTGAPGVRDAEAGVGPPSGPVKAWEWAALSLALLAAWHFLSLRIRAAALPQGDEGSWLSVAAELARGHGFTTRWLEVHFLKPYTLPRPDDFRFPALTVLLTSVFRFTGISWRAAQWTVACVFLLSVSATWFAVRRAFGAWTALAAAFLACFSLLQLRWSSVVYTEGLFGLVLAGLFLAALTGDPATRLWWLRLGACAGALYLVRPNGILFAPGIAWLFLRLRPRVKWDRPLAAFAAMGAVVSPWLWRTWIHFGNPFHLAGSGGMLRNTRAEPSTYGILDYLRAHGTLFPLRRIAVGAWSFFNTLQFYEHGLQILPLFLVLVALLRRRPFYHPFLACGAVFSFTAFAYASFNSWAGVRYAAPFLPFVYAYGLSQLPGWWKSAARLPGAARAFFASRIMHVTVGAAAIPLLLLPVFHPHRFYERSLVPSDASEAISDHVRRLRSLVPEEGSYYAGALAPLNFLAERNCVGLQQLNDSTWFTRSQAAMHPRWLALAHGEDLDSAMAAAIGRMHAEGFALDTVDAGSEGVYLRLRAK